MNEACNECLLKPNYRPVEAKETKGARFLIINKGVSYGMAMRKESITPASSKMLAKHLMECGFHKSDFAFTNTVKCGYDPKKWRAQDRKIIEKCCRSHLTETIQRLKPEVIIPLGADAASAVQGRRVKISKVRGVAAFNDEHEAYVCPTLDPSLAVRYPQNEPLFASDCKTIQRLVEHDYDLDAAEQDALGNYKVITDLQFLIDMEPEYLAFDLETLGTKWRAPNAAIMTMQFSIDEGEGYLLSWDHPDSPAGTRAKKRLKRQLKQLLQNPRTSVIGQNGKFDLTWVYHHLHFRYRLDHDTIMLAALVDENLQQKNLDNLTKMYVPEMAGYADCIVPKTKLLTTNMEWVQANQLVVGEDLLGFDEFVPKFKGRRTMKKSKILSIRRLRKPCIRIHFKSGKNIDVSTNHGFLSRHPKAAETNGGSWKWRHSSRLFSGCGVKAFPQEDIDDTYICGWLGGIYDGEGYITDYGKQGLRLGFSQVDGKVLDKAVSKLHRDGYLNVCISGPEGAAKNVTLSGWNAMKALQKYRPVRLIGKNKWEGKTLVTGKVGVGTEIVDYVEDVGVKEVLSIQTTTHTFIADGLCSHNSFNATYDKSRMDLVPLKKIVNYGVGDTDATLSLFFELIEIVERDEKLYNHYRRVSMPGINAFMRIDHRGMDIDEDALDSFEEVLAKYVEKLRKKLMRRVPKQIKRDHLEAGLKFSRKDFLVDILFKHQKGFRLTPRVYTKTTEELEPKFQVPSTSSKDHLPFFFDHKKAGKFCMDLAEWMKMDRLLGTNVRKFRENYIIDGRINPVYGLWTAVTGRVNSREPNGQNFPKRGTQAKAYRKMFKAPPGYVILGADLSQAELRVIAHAANDPTMIDIYNNNGDIHLTTALIVTGLSLEEFKRLSKEEQGLNRFKAKSVNFGFVFGMWWKNFIIYAKTQYEVEFSPSEAKRIRDEFFNRYNTLLGWQDATKEFAARHGYVRSFDGRTRHLPMVYSQDAGVVADALRQAINAGIQGFASDLGVMAISRLDQEVDEKYLAPMGFVHDAIYAQVREEHVEWGAKTLKHYMESNPLKKWFDLELKVPIVADVEFGWNAGETHEMEGLELDKKYDFSKIDRDEEGKRLFKLPKQRVPPKKGRVKQPKYLRLTY